MSSESLAASWAYQLWQFHFQTQQFYAGAVKIFHSLPFCVVPVHRAENEVAHDLLRAYGWLGEKHKVLADFAAVFEDDRGRLLPTCKFTSRHAAAIQESNGFLYDILAWDEIVASELADWAVDAGVLRDRPQWPYLCDLFEGPQAELLKGELGQRWIELGNDRRFVVTEDQYAIIRGSDELVRTFESALREELERCLKHFADEPKEEFYVTISDIAALADVEIQTVRNKLSESRKHGAAPEKAAPGGGRHASNYRYSEILPWLHDTWPKKQFPDSVEKAKATIARKVAQKSV